MDDWPICWKRVRLGLLRSRSESVHFFSWLDDGYLWWSISNGKTIHVYLVQCINSCNLLMWHVTDNYLLRILKTFNHHGVRARSCCASRSVRRLRYTFPFFRVIKYSDLARSGTPIVPNSANLCVACLRNTWVQSSQCRIPLKPPTGPISLQEFLSKVCNMLKFL